MRPAMAGPNACSIRTYPWSGRTIRPAESLLLRYAYCARNARDRISNSHDARIRAQEHAPARTGGARRGNAENPRFARWLILGTCT
ncbi:hypothetical protein C0Z17_12320 [Trinickia caryophylli]|nr:hypothetical protein C0Z17_12320 [Trinickia caryophylli]